MLAAGALIGSLISAAPARAAGVDADVGGGAAGLMALKITASGDTSYVIEQPTVMMGKNGGAFRRRDVSTLKTVAGLERHLSVRGIDVAVSGNRGGTPFAKAAAVLSRVFLRGTDMDSMFVDCRWDLNAVTGRVLIKRKDGSSYTPAPNTVVDIPLGKLFYNRQRFHSVNVTGEDGVVRQARVINVVGAHLFLNAAARADYKVRQVVIGFASCDPLVLPTIGGLKLLSQA